MCLIYVVNAKNRRWIRLRGKENLPGFSKFIVLVKQAPQNFSKRLNILMFIKRGSIVHLRSVVERLGLIHNKCEMPTLSDYCKTHKLIPSSPEMRKREARIALVNT